MPANARPLPVDAPDIDVALATVITDLNSALTKLTSILGATDQLEGYSDTIEPKLQSIIDELAGTLSVEGDVAVTASALPTGASTAAGQSTGNTSLAAILAKLSSDPATQATLEAVRALLDAGFDVSSLPLPDGAATDAKVEAIRALIAAGVSLADDTGFDVTSLPLPDGAAEQATLAALLAKVIAAPSTEAKQDAANTLLTAIAASVDTLEAKLDTLHTDSVLVFGDSGRKTSTSVGTAVALASNTAARFVRVTALLTNTQQINVGGASALAVAGSTAGDPLLPGDSTTFVVTNLNQVFLDVRVSGEGVSHTWWT